MTISKFCGFLPLNTNQYKAKTTGKNTKNSNELNSIFTSPDFLLNNREVMYVLPPP